MRWIQTIGLGVGIVSLGLSCAHNPAMADDNPGGGKGRDRRGMSPGPAGKLIGADMKVRLTWLGAPDKEGPGEYGRRFELQDRERYYELHVPPQYSPGTAMPMVMVLHGGGGNAADMRWRTGMNDVADKHGFIVLYAAGSSADHFDKMLYWNTGPKAKDPEQRHIDDLRYFDFVIEDVAAYFTIDRRRIYATGFSNGAHMSFRLGCQRHDKIAAIGPVGSQRGPGEFYPPPDGPLNLIYIHGRLDPYAPYEGGETLASAFEEYDKKPVEQIIKAWARHNDCPDEPSEVRKEGEATCTVYGPCRQGSEVVLWTVDNGGHTWPGGKANKLELTGGIGFLKVAEPVGPVSDAIDASEEIWKFFSRHAKPAK